MSTHAFAAKKNAEVEKKHTYLSLFSNADDSLQQTNIKSHYYRRKTQNNDITKKFIPHSSKIANLSLRKQHFHQRDIDNFNIFAKKVGDINNHYYVSIRHFQKNTETFLYKNNNLLTQYYFSKVKNKNVSHIKLLVLQKLMRQLGKPYRWGGVSPETGFDCSGLVYYAYHNLLTIKLPRTANEMYHLHDVPAITKNHLQQGDLVFFHIHSLNPNEADHMGVYIGHGKFIQSPHTGQSIRISYLDDDYWENHFLGAKRILIPSTAKNIHKN